MSFKLQFDLIFLNAMKRNGTFVETLETSISMTDNIETF